MPFGSEEQKYLMEYMARFEREVGPMIVDSALVVAIAPNEKSADIKIALEVGFAILLEKPLIVFKAKDRTASRRLLEIADKVIEGDFETEAERMQKELSEFLEEMDNTKH
jgi:nucleoside 2-deoxyribosyltransferase